MTKTVMIESSIDSGTYERLKDRTDFIMVKDLGDDRLTMVPLEAEYLHPDFSHGMHCLNFYSLHAPTPPDVLILLVADEKRLADAAHLAFALQWCAENGIGLASVSLGTPDYAQAGRLFDAAQSFYESGGVLIAGNSNIGLLSYPACLANTIGVCVDHLSAACLSDLNPLLPHGKFSYADDSANGIELIVSPVAYGSGAAADVSTSFLSSSAATAYFAGLIVRKIAEGAIEAGSENVRMWLRENTYPFHEREKLSYAMGFIREEYGEPAIVAVRDLRCENSREFQSVFQRLFLGDDYYCIAVFPKRTDEDDANPEAVHDLAKHVHVHPDYLDCSYAEYIKLVVQTSRPGLVLVDLHAYGFGEEVGGLVLT